ncbi:hypothetical protein LCGC14_1789570 [marine sediment metagenome]|uniref:Uncharacterized protein n=1 Tax=marine sediment metagenome TaxID=412755 RepID=A0A0F9J7U6_9ZZZZ
MPESLGLPASLGMLDRPGQAVQQTLLGDLPAGFRAMFAPGDLSIKERDSFLKEHGLDKGPWGPVFRMLTNPLLIMTLALSYKFPVVKAGSMFKVQNMVGAMTKRFPIMGRLASMQGLYRGTGIPETYGGVVRDIWDFRSRYNGQMSTLLRQFRSRVGRDVTQKEQLMVSSWLDGLHRPLRGWEGTNGVITIGKGASRVELPAVGTLMPNLEAQMGRPLKQFAEGTRGVLDSINLETFGNSGFHLFKSISSKNDLKKGTIL